MIFTLVTKLVFCHFSDLSNSNTMLNPNFKEEFTFQPSPTAPSMSFTGQSSTVGKTDVKPEDFAFFKDITTKTTPETKKKNNKKKKKTYVQTVTRP